MSASAVIELEPELESEEIFAGGSSPTKRSLGLEVIFLAVQDYRFSRGWDRASAEAFLFSECADYRRQFNLITLISNVDPRWLREQIDRARPGWDREAARVKSGEVQVKIETYQAKPSGSAGENDGARIVP